MTLLTGAWAQLATAAAGLWLMAAPTVLGYGGFAQSVDRMVGPIAVSVGVVAASGVVRGVRWLGLALGLALLIIPWPAGYGTIPLVNSLITGGVVVVLAFVRGAVKDRYGGGWSALVQKLLP